MKDASEPFRFSFPDLEGRIVSQHGSAGSAGKVVLVNISGSWCPNCHDEAPFLASLYRKYRAKGLEIVTLSFEEADQLAEPDAPAGVHRDLRTRLHGAAAGRARSARTRRCRRPRTSTRSRPRSSSGRDGRVRAVHAGFPSPGSGEFYTKAERDDHDDGRAPARRNGGIAMSVRVGRGGCRSSSLLAAVGPAMAQGTRPRATLVTTTPEVTLAAGATTSRQPVEWSCRPEFTCRRTSRDDPLLIPTVLTVDAPAGITVASVSYPSPAELKQTGRAEALLVLGRCSTSRSRWRWPPARQAGCAACPRCCGIRRATTRSVSLQRGRHRRGR